MTNKSICRNKWCKAIYFFEGDIPTGQCQKCESASAAGDIVWADGIVRTSKPEKQTSENKDFKQISSNQISSTTNYSHK